MNPGLTVCYRRLFALALAAALLSGCALGQIMIGVVYAVPTPPAEACPALLWRFAVDAQRGVAGSVARTGERPFGNLSGTLNADDSFHMTLTDMATGRTAVATGQFTSRISTLSIHGDGAGAVCDGQSFRLRLGSYFARQGGGGGGGG